MNIELLPIESVRERDIDLILLEELNVNNGFAEWLVNELKLPKLISNYGAWRSITEAGLGETDILFSYYTENNQLIYILIENKIDSSFTELQYDRYLKRANKYIQDNNCNQAYCVLVAPALYIEDQYEFENYVSYEQIYKRFDFIDSKRYLFKSKLLKIAIKKQRRRPHPVNSEIVQKFWKLYWQNKEKKLPHLFMKKPGIVPYNRDWPYLIDKNIPKIKFIHKLRQGHIDAEFNAISKEAEIIIKQILPENAQFVVHSSRVAVRLKTDHIDRTKDFKEQIDLVDKGLEKIVALREWVIKEKIDEYLEN